MKGGAKSRLKVIKGVVGELTPDYVVVHKIVFGLVDLNIGDKK